MGWRALPVVEPSCYGEAEPSAKDPVMVVLQNVASSSASRSSGRGSPRAGWVDRKAMMSRWFCASLCLLAAACQTAAPVLVQPAFTATPALAVRRPADIGVLPVEDASAGGAASRHTLFLRKEIMRQLVDRRYSPLAPQVVDAAMRGNADFAAATAPGKSILEPAVMKKLVGQSSEEALFALRIDHWDESQLMATKRLNFRCQATLVGSDGQTLWFGTMSGEIKAGGAGAAPRDRDGMARNCAELLVREMLLQLPERLP